VKITKEIELNEAVESTNYHIVKIPIVNSFLSEENCANPV